MSTADEKELWSFAFAGLRFHLDKKFQSQFLLEKSMLKDCTGEISGEEVLGDVYVHLRFQDGIFVLRTDAPQWQWQGSQGQGVWGGAQVSMSLKSEVIFDAQMTVECNLAAFVDGLIAIAIAILRRSNALIFHAAGIECQGTAVLFVGPSGAGKTTAANLSELPWFVVDRVALIRDQHAWVAWALPGGEKEALQQPFCGNIHLPLRAIYGVRQGSTSQIHDMQRLRQAMLLQQNVLTELATENAGSLLEALDDLTQTTEVAEIETVLERSHRALLENRASEK
ncbi:MAG: hypothetical protein IPJ88_02815 [Myxococcales bacterium]|nr:MAG: hypothetical protein IPJ88_02815 [Myxococcales bacterium]